VKHLLEHDVRIADGTRTVRTRLVLSEKSGLKQAMLYWYTIGPYTTGSERLAHFYTGYDAVFGSYSDVVKIMMSVVYGNDAELDSCITQLDSFAREFLVPFYTLIIDRQGHR
jgi:hypothetical protein